MVSVVTAGNSSRHWRPPVLGLISPLVCLWPGVSCSPQPAPVADLGCCSRSVPFISSGVFLLSAASFLGSPVPPSGWCLQLVVSWLWWCLQGPMPHRGRVPSRARLRPQCSLLLRRQSPPQRPWSCVLWSRLHCCSWPESVVSSSAPCPLRSLVSPPGLFSASVSAIRG